MGYTRAEMAALHFADLIERGLERLGDHISSDVVDARRLARHVGAPAQGRFDVSRVVHGRGA